MLVLALTLGPHVEPIYDVASAPLRAVFGAAAAELLLNAVLLAPLGAVAGWVGSRRGLRAAIGLGVAVEVLQAFLGRDPGIDDAAAYIVGAVGGYALAARASERRGPSPVDGPPGTG